MKSALGVLTVFYALGIIFAHSLRLNFWFVAAIAAAVLFSAILAFRKKRLCSTLVFCLALLTGCLNLINSTRLPKNHVRNFLVYDPSLLYSVSGFIAQPPELKNGRLCFILRCRKIQVNQLRSKCSGDILVRMSFRGKFNYGENLTVLSTLRRNKFFSAQRIYLIMPVEEERQIIRRPGFGGKKFIRGILGLRVYLEELISRYLPALPASILSAMVLGQQQNIPWLVKQAMIESGTVHILVVSGFNVGIVAFIANLLLKFMRLSRRPRIILVGICLLIYCLLTGASNPVVRATVMGGVFLAAYFLKREPDIYNTLFCAALFILLISPAQLFDLGFQLSFSSVLAIVYFYPRLKEFMRLEKCGNKILKFFAEGGLVSLSAWLGTLGILAFNFRIFTPVTVLANLLIVPLATLITLAGFAMLLAGLVCPVLAGLFSLPICALINLLLNLNLLLIKLPFACVYF